MLKILVYNTEYQIYFIEYVEISVISRVRSKNEIADIFKTWDEILLVFTVKSKFSFYYYYYFFC